MEKHVCCICGKEFEGYGNTPEPVKPFDDGRCCDECNLNVVIPKRKELLYNMHMKDDYAYAASKTVLESKKQPKYTIGCMSWMGIALAIAIIAIRAFQPNATPMETWSFGSWLLMLFPVLLPFICWIALAFVWLFSIIVMALFSK